MRWATTVRVLVLAGSLAGCGASVSLPPEDASVAADTPPAVDTPPPVDHPIFDVAVQLDVPTTTDRPFTAEPGPPPGCPLPGGGVCPVGASCPAGDGCNTCSCGTNGQLACTLLGCVDAGPPDASHIDVPTAPACTLPNGARCPEGMTCPEGDFCNDCTCTSGTLHCTARPCAFDAGPPLPNCSSTLNCPAHQECAGPPGCGTPWTCRPMTGRFCADDAVPYCGCDGRTFYGSSTCPPEPYASTGACGALDGGAGPSFDCDPRHTECGGIPGPCAAGQVRAVVGACWGDCVDFAGCAPIACDPASTALQCPPASACGAATRTCQPPPR